MTFGERLRATRRVLDLPPEFFVAQTEAAALAALEATDGQG